MMQFPSRVGLQTLRRARGKRSVTFFVEVREEKIYAFTFLLKYRLKTYSFSIFLGKEVKKTEETRT